MKLTWLHSPIAMVALYLSVMMAATYRATFVVTAASYQGVVHIVAPYRAQFRVLMLNQVGAAAPQTASFVALLMGVLILVFGLILSDVVISQAATAGGNPQIGSFGGAGSLNNLIPFIYYTVIVVAGVGLIGIGGLGAVKSAKGAA